MRASTAGGFGLALLCETMLFVGCGGDDDGGDRTGGTGATAGKGGATGGGTGGTGGSTGGTGGSTGGTGGSTGGTGGMAAAVCPTPATVTGGLITDVNGTTNAFTGGGYYIYQDEDKGGTTVPDASVDPPVITPVAGGHEGNALNFTGTGFDPLSWGAGVGIWLECADASGVDGISFFFKSDVSVNVSVTIPETSSTEFGGECTATACTGNSTAVEPAADWTEVTVVWADLTGGTEAFLPDRVQGIDFQIPPPADATADWGFDVWIDHVSWLGGDGAGGNGAGGAGGGAGGAGGAG